MKRLVITYGLISGAIVSAFMSISMIVASKNGSHDFGTSSMVIGYLAMLISFAFIFVAIKAYRDKENNGTISFGKAFGMGLLIALIASAIYVITWAIVYKNFLPNFMDGYSAKMIKEAEATASGAELKAKIDEINQAKAMYDTPWGFTLFTFAEIFPVGFIVSLIAALVLMRRKKAATPAMA